MPFFSEMALSLSRRHLPCGTALETAVRIDASSAKFSAKSHIQMSPFKMSLFRASWVSDSANALMNDLCFSGLKLPQVFTILLISEVSKRGWRELSGVIRANRFARFARIGWFARIGNSSDSCESAWRAIKIGVSIVNDSREWLRANRVANRPCH